MYTTDSTEELKIAIGLAEARQSINRQSIKEQLLLTYDNFRPANLIRSTLKEVTSSPYLISGLAGSVIGLTTGYLSNRVVIGTSASLLRKLLGNILTLGAAKIVSGNSEVIKSYGKGIFKHIFSRRKTDS